MADRFSSNTSALTSPATDGFAIAPSDTLDLPEVTRALYVGGDGDVAVRFLSGQSVVFSGLAGGSLLPVRLLRVHATGTTATGLIGLV